MRLYNGDCLTVMDKLIREGVKVDAIITDPPYGTTKNKKDIKIDIPSMWERLLKLSKPNTPIILFSQGLYTAELMLSQPKLFKYDLIWKKGERTLGFLNANRMPMRNHENILVFYDKLPTYNPQFTEGKPLHGKGHSYLSKENTNNNYGQFNQTEDDRKGETKKYPKSVLNFDRPHPPIHPTQKPVELVEYLIKTYTNENELVLDFTMGSFTTAIACLNTKRNFVGIELDGEYFNAGTRRVEEHLKKLDYKPEMCFLHKNIQKG